MNNKNIFITIMIVCLFLIVYQHNYEMFIIKYKYEKFVSNDNKDLNLYLVPLQNIFLSDNYYNYKLNRPIIKQNEKPLEQLEFNTFLYSKPTTQKIICSSHKNRADCWEDNVNNCQWVHKIDSNSYCGVGPNIWP